MGHFVIFLGLLFILRSPHILIMFLLFTYSKILFVVYSSVVFDKCIELYVYSHSSMQNSSFSPWSSHATPV